MPLPARRIEIAGTQRALTENQVAKLMFPSFDEAERRLPDKAPACTGATVLEDPKLAGASAVRGQWPLQLDDGDILYGSGGDRLKIAWIRSHKFADGSVGGPIAAVRSGQRFAELFALGVYRGAAETTQLAAARMGGDFVVTAESDACTGRKPGAPCVSTLKVLRARRGVLDEIAEIATERVGYGGRAERGASRGLEYRLQSTVDYLPTGLRVHEQVRVIDDSGQEMRKTEQDREMMIGEDGKVTSSEPSLWDRMVDGTARNPAKKGS